MTKTFISFIGSNDAGKLDGGSDDGAILTILAEYRFDNAVLLYNSKGKVKSSGLEYVEVANYLKKEIVDRKHISNDAVELVEMDFVSIVDHSEVFPKLLDFLQSKFDKDTELYAGISSGTPAMQTCWVLIAETQSMPIKLLRSIEKQHSVSHSRVELVNLLTGIKEKLSKLEAMERRIAIKGKTNYTIIEDSLNLSSLQKKIAETNEHILIYGETGTGKEVLARTFHQESKRADKLFVALNCAGLSEYLIESELFGHKRGSFTGATYDKSGLVKDYSEGTILLDEINSLNKSVQAKLLRFMENGEYRSVGSNNVEYSQARIIAASNENLQRLVSEGNFREDLYYRLRTYEFFIPPLRQRKHQIPELIKRLSDLNFDKNSIQLLQRHNYKGNVRELKIILERVATLSDKNMVDVDLVESIITDFRESKQYEDLEIPAEIHGQAYKLLRTMLTNAALNETKGNSLAASKILGVTHPTIKKWM